MRNYPDHLVRKRFLFDGTEVTIRPIRPEDAALEQDFVRHLSADTRYSRFMSELRELSPAKLKYFTEIDYQRQMAFVATVLRDGKEVEVGVSRYAGGAQGDACEFAIAVEDGMQGSGLAGLLMASLMDAARAQGFATMEGYVLANNHRMLKFARQLGFSVRRDADERDTLRVVRSL